MMSGLSFHTFDGFFLLLWFGLVWFLFGFFWLVGWLDGWLVGWVFFVHMFSFYLFCVCVCSYLHIHVNMCFDQELSSCNTGVPHFQGWLILNTGSACMPRFSSPLSFRTGVVQKCTGKPQHPENVRGGSVNKLLCFVASSSMHGESGLTHKFITGMCFQTYSTT